MKKEIEKILRKYVYNVRYYGNKSDTGGVQEIQSGAIPEQIVNGLSNDFISLFESKIDECEDEIKNEVNLIMKADNTKLLNTEFPFWLRHHTGKIINLIKSKLKE